MRSILVLQGQCLFLKNLTLQIPIFVCEIRCISSHLPSQVSRATKEKVDVIAEDTQNLRLSQGQEEREAVLQWLSPLNFAPQQSELSGRRQEGTGKWLLQSPEFQEWVSGEGKSLVCQGMPGAG